MIFRFKDDYNEFFTVSSSLNEAVNVFKNNWIKIHKKGLEDLIVYPYRNMFKEFITLRSNKLKEVENDLYYISRIDEVKELL